MECYWHFFITLIFKASIFEMPGTSLIQFEKIHWFNWQRFSCLIDEGIAKFSMKLNLIDYIWSTYLQGWRNRGGGGGGGGEEGEYVFPPPQILTDQLTLFQPGEADYAHQITTRPSRFSNLPPSLVLKDDTSNPAGQSDRTFLSWLGLPSCHGNWISWIS